MNTLFLNPTTGDITLDASANIALATNPYALAQDAASEIKTFLGEAYYDTAKGIPYFSQILGHPPVLAVMRAQFTAAALLVPEVVSAKVFFSDIVGRAVSGQVQISDSTGAVTAIGF